MSKLERVFEPIKIGGVTIPSLAVRTAHGTWIALARINDELIAYHVARAKGGVGLSYIEMASVHPSNFTLGPLSWDDSIIEGCRELMPGGQYPADPLYETKAFPDPQRNAGRG